MKLTDMNLICLEECVEHLELGDLLSVTDANKRLRKAAGCIYSRKYGMKTIRFHCERMQSDQCIVERTNRLEISSLKTGLQMLRCFGHLITDIDISTHEQSVIPLFMAANEYCAESVVKADLSFNHSSSVFTKPFAKLEELVLQFGLLGEGYLNRTFPRMKRFSNYICFSVALFDINHHRFLVDHYSNLEDFYISYTLVDMNVCESAPIVMQNLMDVLRLNPQLKKLAFRFMIISQTQQIDSGKCLQEETFRSVVEAMPNLEEFRIEDCTSFPNFNGNAIHLKNVKKFWIEHLDIKCPFRFDQLEFFHFELSRRHALSKPLTAYDFIDQHPTIKRLSIKGSYFHINDINVARLMQAVPMLTEIKCDILMESVSIDDVLRFVLNFPLLNKFCFRIYSFDKNLNDEWQTRLGNEWQISMESVYNRQDHLLLERYPPKDGN